MAERRINYMWVTHVSSYHAYGEHFTFIVVIWTTSVDEWGSSVLLNYWGVNGKQRDAFDFLCLRLVQ